MAYLLKSHGKIVSVETREALTRTEREAIIAQLGELAASSAIQGLIIDHRRAEIDMTLEDAAILAESIIRLHALAPLLFIFVVVSEENRFIIDASVALAAARGVPIHVYESKSQAFDQIRRQYPQIELSNRNSNRRKKKTALSVAVAGFAEYSSKASNPFARESASSSETAKARNAKELPGKSCAGSKLSRRESECLLAAAYGLTEKETGKLLGISHNTVSVHVAKCREKLEARNKLNAVVKGIGKIEQETWCKLCSLNYGPQHFVA